MNPLQEIQALGQSIWLDYIRKDLLDSGELTRLVASGEVRGVTSNPSIFEDALATSTLYDRSIRPLAQADWSAEEIFDFVAVRDIRAATDVFLPLYEGTDGRDGYVSIEVNPQFAYESEATLQEARRLWAEVNRPNVMIKIPATEPGIPAVEQAIAEGINVNVTLIFSLERYGQVIEAYLRGLERRQAEGAALNHVSSVASFFVSRLDTLVDRHLESLIRAEGPSASRAAALLGKAAAANAKLAYAQFQLAFDGLRFKTLELDGARAQRPLWASTSTKNPAYSDVLYVESLIGPHTVNTLPPKTMAAFRDHGHADRTIDRDLSASRAQLEALEALGVSMKAVTAQLEREGVEKFAHSFESLLQTIERRSDSFRQEIRSLQPAYRNSLKKLTEAEFSRMLWSRDGGPSEDGSGPAQWLNAPQQAMAELAELQGLQEAIRREGRDVLGWIGLGPLADLAETIGELASGERSLERTELNSADPNSVRRYLRLAPARRSLTVLSDSQLTEREIRLLLNMLWARAKRSRGNAAARSFLSLCRRDTPLGDSATKHGFRRVLHDQAEPGDLFAAFTNAQLLPLLLARLPVEQLIAGAVRMMHESGPAFETPASAGLSLGAALAAAVESGRGRLTFAADPSLEPFATWLVRQLARVCDPGGHRLLPIVGEPLGSPSVYGNDRVMLYLRREGQLEDRIQVCVQAGLPAVLCEIQDLSDLGAEIYRWQLAVVAMNHLLGPPESAEEFARQVGERIERRLREYQKEGMQRPPRGSWKGNGEMAWDSDGRISLGDESPLERFATHARMGLDRTHGLLLLPYHDVHSRERSRWSRVQACVRDHFGSVAVLEGARSLMQRGVPGSVAGRWKWIVLQILLDPARDPSSADDEVSLGTHMKAKAWAEFDVLRRRGHRTIGILLNGPRRVVELAQALSAAPRH